VVPKDTTPVFTVEETGVKPEIRNAREIVRLMERNYPRAYADAGVSGQVTVRFMIDEEGKVPPSSITVVVATNDAFGEAAKKAVEKFQFKPIKYRGNFVRVWATMPINFQPPS
jgi:TonB family protein